MRETERLDADGLPLSKGLGFIEFADPEHALAALRQLNNNPTAFTPDKRPIVEFAIENVKIVKSREAMVEKIAVRKASAAALKPKVSIEEAAAATRAAKIAKREKREAKRLAKKGPPTAAATAAQSAAVSAKAAVAGGSSPGAAAPSAASTATQPATSAKVGTTRPGRKLRGEYAAANAAAAAASGALPKSSAKVTPSDASVMQAVMAAVVEGRGAAAPASAAADITPVTAIPAAKAAAPAAASKPAEPLTPEAEAEAKKESKRQVKRGKQKDRAAKKKAGFIAAAGGGVSGRPTAPVLRPVRPAGPAVVGGVASGGVVKPVAAVRKPTPAAAQQQRPAKQIGGAARQGAVKGASEDAAALKRGRADDAEIDMIAASIGSGGEGNMNGGLRAMGRRGKGGGRAEGVEASDGKKAKRQSGPAENDRLDKIVNDYKVKLFGPGVGEGGAAAGAVQSKAGSSFGIDLKRWFE